MGKSIRPDSCNNPCHRLAARRPMEMFSHPHQEHKNDIYETLRTNFHWRCITSFLQTLAWSVGVESSISLDAHRRLHQRNNEVPAGIPGYILIVKSIHRCITDLVIEAVQRIGVTDTFMPPSGSCIPWTPGACIVNGFVIYSWKFQAILYFSEVTTDGVDITVLCWRYESRDMKCVVSGWITYAEVWIRLNGCQGVGSGKCLELNDKRTWLSCKIIYILQPEPIFPTSWPEPSGIFSPQSFKILWAVHASLNDGPSTICHVTPRGCWCAADGMYMVNSVSGVRVQESIKTILIVHGTRGCRCWCPRCCCGLRCRHWRWGWHSCCRLCLKWQSFCFIQLFTPKMLTANLYTIFNVPHLLLLGCCVNWH